MPISRKNRRRAIKQSKNKLPVHIQVMSDDKYIEHILSLASQHAIYANEKNWPNDFVGQYTENTPYAVPIMKAVPSGEIIARVHWMSRADILSHDFRGSIDRR